MSEWQPIATAPRTGIDILAIDAKLADGFPQVVYFEEPSDKNAGWCWCVNDAGISYHEEFFTHWMPIPDLPTDWIKP